ncbi:tRNA adenosine(34) deaminase TadA [Candidatus Pseudothioglobus singularis]|nr:tRNA adenosine(34) deaminase TadA [Candidatus Pseudothioglobus singularis]MDC3216771.1 tRNA adenosine(34) deaminase TadA [Candidatus Pseudothioglobus singularis]
MTKDEKWMQIAIAEAKLAIKEKEIPVGSVLVQNEKIIAQAHNQPIGKNDPTAHAEIQLLRKAGKQLENYRLGGSTLYVTLEPCAMCFGAIIHARIERIVFGALDPKTGVCGSCLDLNKEDFFNHKISITGGVLDKECSDLLRLFFKSKRDKRR